MIQKSYTTAVEISAENGEGEITPVEQMQQHFFAELCREPLIFDFLMIPPERERGFSLWRNPIRYPQITLNIDELEEERHYFLDCLNQRAGLIVGISFKRQSFLNLFQEHGWKLNQLPQLEAKALINHFFTADVLSLAARLKAGNLFLMPPQSPSIYLINGANLKGIL